MKEVTNKQEEPIYIAAEPQPATDQPKFIHQLSSRETDVLIFIKNGLRNPEIAKEIGLSTKTVENHVRSILLKLGAKNRTDAVIIAVKNDLIQI